ncbi:ATP-grasp domain-containing protein [Streptomyces sp. NPDC058221]|uniref:ATP-grasp domain-containing protein n=1 Tax=Streptomyces sp. NPDC058221 TaxID=3346388 RepID=UPI0036E45249
MTDTLLLVGAGIMGRGYVAAARDLGLRTVLLDDEAWREKHEQHVAHFETPAGGTETHWLRAALDAADRYPPQGAVPFAEQHVLAAARVQDRLGLPGPSLAAAEASRNKAVQRALFSHSGLPQPDYAVVDDADRAAEWSRGRYPVVVKPLRGVGSAGVRCVAGEDELRADLTRRDLGQQVLIEEYVDAPEYSWEALVQNGEVIFGNHTRKVTTGPPEFVEMQHRLPHRPADRDRVDGQTAALVAAAGIRTGIVHLEYRDDGTVLRPMEFAVRTPGDHILELMCRAYGHDFFRSVIELSLGREVGLPSGRPRAAGVVFLSAASPGRITSVDGVEAAQLRPDVVRVGQKKHAGDIVTGLHSSGDRVAHALLLADTSAGVDAAADAVLRQIEIRVEPPSPEPAPAPAASAASAPAASAAPAAEPPLIAEEGPVVVLCKWRPDMVRALLAATPNLHLVLEESELATAAASPELTAAARSVYRVGSVDSIEELTGVSVDLAVRGVRVDQVLSFSEDAQLGAALLRALLGCGEAGAHLGAAVRDKRMMKRLVGAAGVAVTEWASLPTDVTFADGNTPPDVGFPAVVKPAFGFGTMSTLRVENAAEITAFLHDLPKPDRLASGHLIVERFVPGRELHIDALWREGKALFLNVSAYYVPRLDHVATDGAAHAATPTRDGSYVLAPEDHPELHERILAMHTTVNEALGIDTAVTHLEVFETPTGDLVFSEIATRIGGGWIPDMLTARLGQSVFSTVATGLLYGAIEPGDSPYRHIGALHLRPSRAGTITALPTGEQIEAVDGVISWRLMKKTGDRVGFSHAMDWCLMVVVGADTAEEFEATLDRVETQLTIEVE